MRAGMELALAGTEVAQRPLRTQLRQAIFKNIFVANEEVVGDDINSPLAELLAAHHDFRARSAGLSQGDALEQAIADPVDTLHQRQEPPRRVALVRQS